MRIAITAIAILLASATAATAEPAEIPFRDLFATLAEKTTRASDQAFFETVVLRGQARAEPDRFSIVALPQERFARVAFGAVDLRDAVEVLATGSKP